MLKLLQWLATWTLRIISLIQLKKMGWKYFALGLTMMFVVPTLLKACL